MPETALTTAPEKNESALNNLVTALLNTCAKLANTQQVEEHTFYARGLGPASVVVDLGGNKGRFSQYMVDNFPSTVFAVEPSPDLFANFPRHERIKVFQYVIGANSDPVTFYLSEFNEANSTNQDLAKSWGTKGAVTIDGITLPKFLEMNGVSDVDLLKIDIEGAEFDLFKSLSDDFLRAHIKQITVEFHDFMEGLYDSQAVVDIKNRLEGLGFLTINTSARNGNNADVLFVNGASDVTPPARLGMRLMHTMCRNLADRKMRQQSPSAKKIIIL